MYKFCLTCCLLLIVYRSGVRFNKMAVVVARQIHRLNLNIRFNIIVLNNSFVCLLWIVGRKSTDWCSLWIVGRYTECLVFAFINVV